MIYGRYWTKCLIALSRLISPKTPSRKNQAPTYRQRRRCRGDTCRESSPTPPTPFLFLTPFLPSPLSPK